jgi:hypothetical protein
VSLKQRIIILIRKMAFEKNQIAEWITIQILACSIHILPVLLNFL